MKTPQSQNKKTTAADTKRQASFFEPVQFFNSKDNFFQPDEKSGVPNIQLTPAEHIDQMLRETIPSDPGVGRETMASNRTVINEVDQAIHRAYGRYIMGRQRLSRVRGGVSVHNPDDFLTAFGQANRRGNDPIQDVLYQRTLAGLRQQRGFTSSQFFRDVVSAIQRDAPEGLNTSQPWNSTGPALSLWRAHIIVTGRQIMQTAQGRAQLGLPEGFHEPGNGHVHVIENSPYLYMTMAHESIHYYTSDEYKRAISLVSVDNATASGVDISDSAAVQNSAAFRNPYETFIEGGTQYFTFQLFTEGHLRGNVDVTSYQSYVNNIIRQVNRVGEETFRRAFFSGDRDAITQIVGPY
ncbi:MAG: hypothetical protein AAF502_06990 [Bacteroidota bacterium]